MTSSHLIEILIIAFALSLDATAASISCGIKLKVIHWRVFFKIAFTFAFLQSLMPLVGMLFSQFFLITMIPDSWPKWIAFSVFFVLALKTLKEAFDHLKEKSDDSCCFCLDNFCLFTLGIATSIDALLIGVIYPFKFQLSPFIAIPIFGIVTFLNSLIGLSIGNRSFLLLRKFSYFIASFLLMALAFKGLIWQDA